ncbi:esterase/lipase/thioesterase [Patellaria atrata CBS 101060]|uniref:Esterase/lipase/thioesterase n=1 Tax=Patellaria atrata CBS 101060 TaxID=1346257 RepID=A0A9P4VTE9_9PEZI|nr:esterase/lipase/thioesterase [Patellaria atrata CBS 101060]
MRWNGETPLPKPTVLEEGVNFDIPSREAERHIPCRMFKPSDGRVKGLFLHIHGGGWVLQSENYQDTLLKFLADAANLTVISVGYRLAPEDPWPAGPDDCNDAAEYFVDNGPSQFGAELMFAGGESAGAHLTALIAIHLLNSRPSFRFHGLVLNCGAYDLSNFLPAVSNFHRLLVLDHDIMKHYVDVLCPNTTAEQRRDPRISPFFTDFKRLPGKLPPALFTVGTEDCLLDDTVMMVLKWQMSGAEGVCKVYPGAPHGFLLFTDEQTETAGQCRAHIKEFLHEKIAERKIQAFGGRFLQ